MTGINYLLIAFMLVVLICPRTEQINILLGRVSHGTIRMDSGEAKGFHSMLPSEVFIGWQSC